MRADFLLPSYIAYSRKFSLGTRLLHFLTNFKYFRENSEVKPIKIESVYKKSYLKKKNFMAPVNTAQLYLLRLNIKLNFSFVSTNLILTGFFVCYCLHYFIFDTQKSKISYIFKKKIVEIERNFLQEQHKEKRRWFYFSKEKSEK